MCCTSSYCIILFPFIACGNLNDNSSSSCTLVMTDCGGYVSRVVVVATSLGLGLGLGLET